MPMCLSYLFSQDGLYRSSCGLSRRLQPSSQIITGNAELTNSAESNSCVIVLSDSSWDASTTVEQKPGSACALWKYSGRRLHRYGDGLNRCEIVDLQVRPRWSIKCIKLSPLVDAFITDTSI